MTRRILKKSVSFLLCFAMIILIAVTKEICVFAYEEPISLGKNVIVSSTAAGEAKNVTDGTVESFWASAWVPSGMQYATVDLGDLCSIDRIEIFSAEGNLNSRKYFRVIAAKDISFSDYSEIVPCPESEIEENALSSFDVNDSGEYRFVRIERTNYTEEASFENAFVVKELSVFGSVQRYNLAVRDGIVTSVSSTGGSNGKEYINDGVVGYPNYWSSNWINDGPEWVMLDLGSFYELSDVQIYTIIGNEPSRRDFIIYASKDGVSWEVLVTSDGMEIPENSGYTFSKSSFDYTGETRFVKVIQNSDPGGQGYAISEISVYGNFLRKCPSNIAYGKVPTSNISDKALGVLTDGNTNNYVEFIQTGDKPWVQIDLGGYYYIDSLSLYLRNPLNDGTSKNFEILAASSNPNFLNPDEYDVLWAESDEGYPTETDKFIEKAIAGKKAYRYIRYRKTVNEYLYMSEIAVYGLAQELLVKSDGYTIDGESVHSFKPNKVVKHSANIENNSDLDKNIYVLSVLSKDNRAKMIDFKSQSLQIGQNFVFDTEVGVPADTNGLKLDTFYFDSLEEYSMISNPESMKINEASDGTHDKSQIYFDYYNDQMIVDVTSTDEDREKMFVCSVTKPAADKTAQSIYNSDGVTELSNKFFAVLSDEFKTVSLRYIIDMEDEDLSGEYTMLYSFSDMNTSTLSTPHICRYYNASERKKLLKNIKNHMSDITAFENFVIGCEGDLLNAVDLENPTYVAQKATVISAVKDMLDENPDVKDIVDSFNWALTISKIVNSDSIKPTDVDKMVELFKLDREYYKDGIKNKVSARMTEANKRKPLSTSKAIIEAFNEAVILSNIENISNSELTKLIEHYSYLNLLYGEASPELVNKYLINRKFEYITEFKTAFGDAVYNVLNKKENKPLYVGGGGGGGVSIATSPKDEPNIESSQEKTIEYTDISHIEWAREAIEFLTKRGVNGVGNGQFAPDSFLKREEGAKMIISALDIKAINGNEFFADAKGTEWYVPYLSTVSRFGYFMGDEKGNFGVGRELSREDLAVVLLRVLESNNVFTETSNAKGFADDASISDYAKRAVDVLSELKIINGTEGGMFLPKKAVTRAEAAKMIYGVVTIIEKGGVNS